MDRPQRALVKPYGLVGVYCNDEAVAQLTGYRQILNVSRVKEIEAAASEPDLMTGGFFGRHPVVYLLVRPDLRGGVHAKFKCKMLAAAVLH